jgi:UDPglucose 6-dehydrogenase
VQQSVTVIGTGYVGLVTGACLADLGHHVICLDIDAQRVTQLTAGVIPIFEPGLDDIVLRNIDAGRLHFTIDVPEAVGHGDIMMIAVGTPSAPDGSADLSAVFDVARTIGRHVTHPVVVIDKSTVPVGTGDEVERIVNDEVAARGLGFTVSVVSNPEFLKEGAAIADFMQPDRIVVGSENPSDIDSVRSLYQPLLDVPERLLVTSRRSAELIKYAANSMLATRISFMNELSQLAERLDANIDDVKRGIGSDPRIGPAFLNAGAGYGGACFPKDVQALIHTAQSAGLGGLRILSAVEAVNTTQKAYLLDKIDAELPDITGLTVAVWGLAFKPHTDDVRDATSAVVIAGLLARGAHVQAFDPVARESFERSTRLPGVVFEETALAALDGADFAVIVTEWPEFSAVAPTEFASRLSQRTVFDGRNIYRLDDMRGSGVRYHSIGRPPVG